MKKILFFLLFPVFIFSQTADEFFERALDKNKKNDFQYQIDNYTKCLKINPNYFEAYDNRGRAFFKLKKYNAAIADYTKFISFNNKDAKVYNNRGIAYSMIENYYKAISDFTKSMKIDSKYSNPIKNRGRAYYYLGKYNEAIMDFTNSLKLDPNNPNTYRDRGVCKEESGLYYCDDFKAACRLGNSSCCEWYQSQCR